MKKTIKRIPRNYDGVHPTGRLLSSLLSPFFSNLGLKYAEKPDQIVAAWPEVVGDRISKMTRAVSYTHGTLRVLVSHSTLYSLLVEHEKTKLIRAFQIKFPKAKFVNILFKIGQN